MHQEHPLGYLNTALVALKLTNVLWTGPPAVTNIPTSSMGCPNLPAHQPP